MICMVNHPVGMPQQDSFNCLERVLCRQNHIPRIFDAMGSATRLRAFDERQEAILAMGKRLVAPDWVLIDDTALDQDEYKKSADSSARLVHERTEFNIVAV